MPKGRLAELKKNQREFAESTKGSTRSTARAPDNTDESVTPKEINSVTNLTSGLNERFIRPS
jgi:hypothetical protein